MSTPRKEVHELLVRMETNGAYSNLILSSTLSREKLSARDKAFASMLFYGVLERKITLDYIIREYSKIEFDKLAPETVVALRMGLYQLLYANSVPENAAVNESVSLCGHDTRGFINAILRNFIRNGLKIDLSRLEDEAKLSIEYSCPKWLIKKWTRQFGEADTLELLKASFGRPPLYVRVNKYKYNTDTVINALSKEKIKAVKNKLLEDCLELENVQGIELTDTFRKGMFHVQDISSQLSCRLIRPVFNETVLDLCAAPGGKSFTMAQMMNNRGKLISCDLYEGKLSLIREGAKRLGLSIIEATENDAAEFNPDLPEADRVLCDVPCSGLGVIRRKPEIKYKPMKSFEGLPEIQKTILETSSKYVKQGGALVYSTCTLNCDENEAVVDDFISRHPEFSPYVVPLGISGIKDNSRYNFMPHQAGGDGFFTATFRRVK